MLKKRDKPMNVSCEELLAREQRERSVRGKEKDGRKERPRIVRLVAGVFA